MRLTPEQIARIAHEANRAYCFTLGDFSLPTWDQTPPWQKAGVIDGVKAALDDPNITPEKSHEGWLAAKLKAGWKYGVTKRPEVLEHPCVLPWAELSAEMRLKDVLFLAAINAVKDELPATAPQRMSEEPTDPGAKRKDDTQEVGILTENGNVVKDAEIVPEVKPKKKKRGLLGG